VLQVWSKRHRDLGRARTQVACRLHQVRCELIPGGVPGEITAGQAGQILAAITPAGAVAAARRELAAGLTGDLRGAGTRIRETRKKTAAAVRAAGTSLTGLFGVGPVIAAAVIGDVRHVSRFPNRDHFAADNGTAPIEVSCGGRKIYRLSRRGNRRLNHAIHMAAVTQIRCRHSPGRACYDKKLAEGKTGKEALRCLKRQISDAIFACRQTGARRAAAAPERAREGNRGTTLHPGQPARTPGTGASDKPLPGLPPTLRPPLLPFPAPLPTRASGRPGQEPGAARPRSGARRASLTRPPGSR
jgi:transposase